MDTYWSRVLSSPMKSHGVVTIYEHERGLLYRRGAFVRLLGPGRYRLWPWSRALIRTIDTRMTILPIANQKVLTSDQATVTVNLSVNYRISDPVLATHGVADCVAQLYSDTQLAARNALAAATLDQLIADRGSLGDGVCAAMMPLGERYGIAVESVGIKDIILSSRMRDVLAREIEAKRVAQATLVAAREEVAALRAMANAARLVEQHPGLLRLRELETVRAVSQAGGNTVVLGVGSTPGVGVAPSGGGAPQSEEDGEADAEL